MSSDLLKKLSLAVTAIGFVAEIGGSLIDSKLNEIETKEIVYECIKEQSDENKNEGRE